MLYVEGEEESLLLLWEGRKNRGIEESVAFILKCLTLKFTEEGVG